MSEEDDEAKKLHDKILNNIIAERYLLDVLSKDYILIKKEPNTKPDDKANEAIFAAGFHNEDISHQASSSEWGAAMTLSGILLTAFAILVSKDTRGVVSPLLMIEFVSLNVLTCVLLISNFRDIKAMFVNENEEMMGLLPASPLNMNVAPIKAKKNGKDSRKNDKKNNNPRKERWIVGKENISYSALFAQFSIILVTCITIR